VLVLTWGVLTFAARPLPVHSQEVTVDIVSASDFSQLTAGSQNAPKVEKAMPLVDKVGERTPPPKDPNARVATKEVNAATDVPPPTPAPQPPAPAQPKQQSEPKRDLIADAIKKDDAKKGEQKQADAKVPTPPKRPPQPHAQPKFDPREMQALLDKRDPQRKESTGDTLSDSVSLGTPKGSARQLTQSELDALRARLAQLWNPPAGAQNPEELVVAVRMRLKPDGTLAAPPMVTTSGQSALFMAARDSAIRAVFRGQPFDMLRPETYELWKDIEVTFDPRDMIRG